MKVLKMLEDKKISSGEAMQLLESIGKLDSGTRGAAGGRGRLLKIRVYKEDSSEAKVNVNIPLVWSKFITPLVGGRIKEELANKGYSFDFEKIQEALDAGEVGRVVDVNDDKSRIEVYIE